MFKAGVTKPLNILAWDNEIRLFVLFSLVHRAKVMINRDSWGHYYLIVRGEILRFIKD